jgi:hypothetical protein
LGEDQVGGDDDGFVFVTLGEKLEEDFHLVAGVLNIADVIDHDGIEAVEACDHLGKPKVAFGGQKLVDQFEGRHEEDSELMAADPLAAEGGGEVGLAAAGQAEAEQVVATAEEIGLEQGRDLAADLFRQPFLIECLEGLALGQVRFLELAVDLALQPIIAFGLEQKSQEALIAPVLRLGPLDSAVVLAGDGR